MQKLQERKYYKAFIAVLMIVLLSCCVFVGSLLAWLTDEDIKKSEGVIEIGSVDFEIYKGDVKITTIKHNSEESSAIIVSPTSKVVEVESGEIIRDIDLTIRNTGTVSAIMRVTLAIYYYDENDNKVPCILATSSAFDNHISITNTGWINDFSNIDSGDETQNSIVVGYSYYNSQIQPYTIRTVHNLTGEVTIQDISAHAVPVLTQILVPESKRDTTYYIEIIQVEGVAYSGNIYQEDLSEDGEHEVPVEAYPFGHVESLPENWTAWK